MQPAVSITEDDLFATLRAFLLNILDAECEVVRAQTNRVAAPNSDNYVTMTPLMRQRIATTATVYQDDVNGQYRFDRAPMQYTVQLDIHGPASSDNAHIIGTLFRSEVAVQHFKDADVDASPLFNTDPRQVPFTNGEQQVEDRWTMDLTMQVNSVITTEQQFADALDITVINADAAYPPG